MIESIQIFHDKADDLPSKKFIISWTNFYESWNTFIVISISKNPPIKLEIQIRFSFHCALFMSIEIFLKLDNFT